MGKKKIIIIVVATVLLVVVGGIAGFFIAKGSMKKNNNEGNNVPQVIRTQTASIDESRLKSAINHALVNLAKREEEAAEGYYAKYFELGRENRDEKLDVYVWAIYGKTDSKKNEKSGTSIPIKLTFNLDSYELVDSDIPRDGTNYKTYFSTVAEKLKEVEYKEKNSLCGETYYDVDTNSGSTYSKNLTDAKNGRIAFENLYNRSTFKTEDHGDYFTYIDQFNNKYDIREVKKVTSENGIMSVDNTNSLFKVTITYLDKDNQSKTMELAITLQSDFVAGSRGTFLNYTGTTSFVKGYTNLYDDGSDGNKKDEENKYNISGEFYGKFGTFTVENVNNQQLKFKFNGASKPDGKGVMEIAGTADKIPDDDKESTYRFEHDGTATGSIGIIKGNTSAKPSSHYRYQTIVDGAPYKIIVYFTSDKNLTYLEWSGEEAMKSSEAPTMMNMSKE